MATTLWVTTGGDITKDIVTNSSVNLPVQFNVAVGAFLGSTTITEWVVGRRAGAGTEPAVMENVDGAIVTLAIQGPFGSRVNSVVPTRVFASST